MQGAHSTNDLYQKIDQKVVRQWPDQPDQPDQFLQLWYYYSTSRQLQANNCTVAVQAVSLCYYKYIIHIKWLMVYTSTRAGPPTV